MTNRTADHRNDPAARDDPSNPGSAAHRAMIDKVRKLLAMAERSPHPDEADAFSRKAAELIAAHRLDPDRLTEAADDVVDITNVDLGRGAYVRARLALLSAVATAHGCRVVFGAGRHGTVAHVAGLRSDLETVDVLYTSLHAQAAARMAAEHRSTGAATQRWRRSFLFGFAHEVGTMLRRSQEQAERDSADRGRSTLPALLAREQRAEELLQQRFGRIVAARAPASPTATGYHAGRDAASRSDLGRPRVRATPALGPGG